MISDTAKRMETQGHAYVTYLKDFPDNAHFAVLIEESFSYDDGYGERGMSSTSTHHGLQYIAFANESALNAWVRETDASAYGRKTYRVIRCTPVTVQKTVSFEFKE